MSLKGGLDRLQKEIDALTYNARTILNALIRSVVVSGSNQGFKATRVGEEIFLSRIDIYRLSTFYRDWENNEFATADVVATNTQKALTGFDNLITQHDLTPVKDESGNVTDSTPTTTALVKHSKIIYKNSNNATNTDADWLNLIKNSNNAKLITNSSLLVTFIFSSTLLLIIMFIFISQVSIIRFINYY